MKVTMDVRERLIDLMSEAKRIDPEDAPFSEYLADFMISHGVTVREPDGCRYCKETAKNTKICPNTLSMAVLSEECSTLVSSRMKMGCGMWKYPLVQILEFVSALCADGISMVKLLLENITEEA